MKPAERVEFRGSTGERLAGLVDLPLSGSPAAYALFAHCFTGSKGLPAMREIARALTGAGLGVLRFDFTGLGESEGDFSRTNLSSNASDLVAAAEFLAKSHAAPEILLGHSLGGAAVLQAAAAIPSVSAIATIGAPAEPEHVFHLISDELDDIRRSGAAEVELAGRRFTIRKQFLDDLEALPMRRAIADLDRPLLIFHSPVDEIVGIENAASLYAAARHPKSFVSVDGADHLLSRAADATFVGTVVAAWARRYIDLLESDPEHTMNARIARGARLPSLRLAPVPSGEPVALRGGRGPRLFLIPHGTACAGCQDYLGEIAASAGALEKWGGGVSLVLPWAVEDPGVAGWEFPGVTVLADPERKLATGLGLKSAAIVVSDEWGEIHFAAEAGAEHELPRPEELVEWARFIAIQCPECEQPEGRWKTLGTLD